MDSLCPTPHALMSAVPNLEAVGAHTDLRLPNRAELAWLLPELGPAPMASSADLDLARARLVEAIETLPAAFLLFARQ